MQALDAVAEVVVEARRRPVPGFAERVADTGIAVIIPHMGLLNGGYARMSRFFDCGHVCFDTSCADATARWCSSRTWSACWRACRRSR